MKKKMIDIRVFDQSGGIEKIRLYNIDGTDDYYVSGKAFVVKSMRHGRGLSFYNPDSYKLDCDGNYHPSTDLPDYVRDIYFMVDGELMSKIAYRNPGYKKSILISICTYDNNGSIRIYNIEGTDDYYIFGSEFDQNNGNKYGILLFELCWRWTEDSKGLTYPVKGLPDRVRRVYRMDDGEITCLLYDNPNYRDIVTRSTRRDRTYTRTDRTYTQS